MVTDSLAEVGIRVTGLGDHRTTCPQCSHKRKPGNRKIRCLSVTVEHDGAVYHCHHCGWSGCVREAKPGGDRSRQKPGHQRADFGSARRRLRYGVFSR